MADAIACSVACCDVPRRKREWCGRHYAAWRRHGDPTVAKYHWVNPGGACIICGSTELPVGSRRYCSSACSIVPTRARRAGMSIQAYLARYSVCRGCGDLIQSTPTSQFRWCTDCHAQRQKHGMSAKMLARRDGDSCGECGERVALTIAAPDPQSPSIDRIVPRSRGGSEDPDNLRLVHRVCNQNKGDLIGEERLITHCTADGCTSPLNNRAMGLCKSHMQPLRRAGLVPPEMRGSKAYVRLSGTA